MTEVKNDFNFQRATSLDVQDDGSDPTNELYKFASNAGELAVTNAATPIADDNGDGPQYLFYNVTKTFEPAHEARSNLCLGNYTHRNYKIDRFGNVFYAEWLMRRENSGVTSYLKDYEATGTSIDPADIGKVFKGAEFTEAMAAFYGEYTIKTKALAAEIKNSPHAKALDLQAYGELAAAVQRNDLAAVFDILFEETFVDENMDTITEIEKLRQYLDMGLLLSRQNPREYKMKNILAIKAAIVASDNPFKGLQKMSSGEKQAEKVKERLTKQNVLNALCTELFYSNPLLDLAEDVEIGELDETAPAVADETTAVETAVESDADTSPAEAEPARDAAPAVDTGLSSEVAAALAASSGEIPHRDDPVDGLRRSATEDGLALPTEDPQPEVSDEAQPVAPPAAPAPAPAAEPENTSVADTLTFQTTSATFQLGKTAPEFKFAGDVSQIKSVTNGFNKKPLAFTVENGRLVVTGLVAYSKAVIKHLMDNNALLSQADAEKKAKMDYPIVVTLSDGTKVTLKARAE